MDGMAFNFCKASYTAVDPPTWFKLRKTAGKSFECSVTKTSRFKEDRICGCEHKRDLKLGPACTPLVKHLNVVKKVRSDPVLMAAERTDSPFSWNISRHCTTPMLILAKWSFE